MSAPAFAIPVAPPVGHAATGKRGAATPDADFAAILGETETAEVAAPPSARTAPAPKSDSEPSRAEVAETPAEPVIDAGTLASAPVVPLPVAPPPVVSAPLAVPPATAPAPETVEAAPAPVPAIQPPVTPDADDIIPDSNAAAVEAAPQAPAGPDADADLALARAVQAEQAEQARAATPSPTAPPTAAPTPPPPVTAAVASLLTRPASPVPAVSAPVGTDDAGAAEAPSPDAPAAEAPRTRDVIERAQSTRNAASAAVPTATGNDQPPASPSQDQTRTGQTQTAQTAPSAPRPAPATQAAVAAMPVAPDTPAAAPVAPSAAPESRPIEAAGSPVLSALSHATIETTARIAAQIVRKLEGRSTRFEMALTPDGLGQVDVSLDIDADGKLIARMAFDNPLAATELRGRVDDLRRQLQESGFTVADDALSFTERDPAAGGFAGRDDAFDRHTDPRNTRAFGAASRLNADADELLTPARWIPLALAPDRVDMKV